MHLVLWTLVPWLTSFNAPLDVIEGYAWGREWLIGTYKHPPMQAWWLEILAILTGRASWAHFLASQSAIIIAFWAVWQMGRRLTNDVNALLGVVLLEGIAYYTFTSPEFNPNVLQLPFWALACWSFHRAVKENRWFDWTLLGLWMAGGLYTKYSMLLIIGLLFALLAITPEGRTRWKSFGPYLSLVFTFALIGPHVNWLFNHAFLPFTYAQSRTSGAATWLDHLIHPLEFLGAVALALLPFFILVLFLSSGRLKVRREKTLSCLAFDRLFLPFIALGPIAVLLALSVTTGFRPKDMWGSYLWNFIGLWTVVTLIPPLTMKRLRAFVLAWSFVFFLGLFTITFSNLAGSLITHKPLRIQFPGEALTKHIVNRWQESLPGTLPAYVIGDTWLAGNIAYYTPSPSSWSRPRVFIAGDPVISPWIDTEDIERQGGILIWCSNRCADEEAARSIPAHLRKLFPAAQIQPSINLSWQRQTSLPPLYIGWAILPPYGTTRLL